MSKPVTAKALTPRSDVAGAEFIFETDVDVVEFVVAADVVVV